MRSVLANGLRGVRMPLRAPVGKRFASNTTADAQKKAQDVMSGAQKNAQKFLEFAKKYSGSVGDRLGGVLGCTYISLFLLPVGKPTVEPVALPGFYKFLISIFIPYSLPSAFDVQPLCGP